MATLSAKQIKLIRSLSLKKFRDESGLFVVEGEKLVNEALRSDFKIKEIYKREEIGFQTMERISSLASPPPILAIVEQKRVEEYMTESSVKAIASGKNPLVLFLENIKDPGNLGTIIRVADWFGVEMLCLTRGCVELYNPKVVQSTMGAIFREKIALCEEPSALLKLFKTHSLPIYATSLHGENLYAQKEPLAKGVIIMGNESEGVSKELSSLAERLLLIPPYRIAGYGSESLNVATATAIICAEFRRDFFALQLRKE